MILLFSLSTVDAMTNYERMIQMAEAIFDAHHDPDQLQVDEQVIEALIRLHPASVTELDEGDGPVVWILLIPTTVSLMQAFVDGKISEAQLLKETVPGERYDALYLCSAMVLPEYRKRGLATQLTLAAIQKIREQHPIQYVFVWPFTNEGKNLAVQIAKVCHLPLLERAHHSA